MLSETWKWHRESSSHSGWKNGRTPSTKRRSINPHFSPFLIFSTFSHAGPPGNPGLASAEKEMGACRSCIPEGGRPSSLFGGTMVPRGWGEHCRFWCVICSFLSFYLYPLGPGCRIIKVVHRRVGFWVSKTSKLWMKNYKGYFRESENSGVIVEKFETVIP